MKSIRISGHARDNMFHRGASESEVIETIRSAIWTPAELGRFECRADFDFGKEWNGKFYTTKQVRPIFVKEDAEIVVVTVYVYYF